MLGIALEIPLPLLALGWCRKRRDMALARVQGSREHVDRTALSGGVASLEDNDQALACLLDPARGVAQFLGQWRQQLLILLPSQRALATHAPLPGAKPRLATASPASPEGLRRKWRPG